MERVKDIRREDLVRLGFKMVNRMTYKYMHGGVPFFYASIHDTAVDTFFVGFRMRDSYIEIDSKSDLKNFIQIISKNTIQTWKQ